MSQPKSEGRSNTRGVPGDRHVIDPEVLKLLRCPNTGGPLKVHVQGMETELCTLDGRRVYVVRNGIPVLLPVASPSPLPDPNPVAR